MSASSYTVVVEMADTIDSIAIEYINSVDTIVVSAPELPFSAIDIQRCFAPLLSVNGYTGDPYFTASTTLGVVSPVSGVYSYNFTHGLHYANPVVMLYNSNNETVSGMVTASGSETVNIKSLIDLNGYKVVVQS